MIFAHGLAPVRHDEVGIDVLCVLECEARVVKLKTVERLYAGQKGFLRGLRTRIGKRDTAQASFVGECAADWQQETE